MKIGYIFFLSLMWKKADLNTIKIYEECYSIEKYSAIASFYEKIQPLKISKDNTAGEKNGIK